MTPSNKINNIIVVRFNRKCSGQWIKYQLSKKNHHWVSAFSFGSQPIKPCSGWSVWTWFQERILQNSAVYPTCATTVGIVIGTRIGARRGIFGSIMSWIFGIEHEHDKWSQHHFLPDSASALHLQCLGLPTAPQCSRTHIGHRCPALALAPVRSRGRAQTSPGWAPLVVASWAPWPRRTRYFADDRGLVSSIFKLLDSWIHCLGLLG